MTREISLAGRVAVVTGAAGGVGSEVCVALAGAGAAIVLSDMDAGRLEAVRARLPAPESHLVHAANLGEPEACRGLVSAALARYGRIDVLANVAAVLHRIPFLKLTEADYQTAMDVNLRSQFLLCQGVVPHMAERGQGAIINFASPSAFTGGRFDAVHYAASKAGTIALSRGLAQQFGGQGVRTNVLCPGTTDTPMIRDTLSAEQVAAHIKGVPMGRIAKPSEIANGVLFLASDLASFVNGTVLTIDGGASLRP
jgi:3-oxoacyl-[acyl-carrier protein] reductase